MPGRSRGGFSILEPVVALAILGLAGGGWIALLAETRAAGASVDRVERQTRSAATLLAGLAREPRRSLVARAGRRRIGPHEVRISHRDGVLFSIAIVDPSSQAVLLETVVYRPRESDDAR